MPRGIVNFANVAPLNEGKVIALADVPPAEMSKYGKYTAAYEAIASLKPGQAYAIEFATRHQGLGARTALRKKAIKDKQELLSSHRGTQWYFWLRKNDK